MNRCTRFRETGYVGDSREVTEPCNFRSKLDKRNGHLLERFPAGIPVENIFKITRNNPNISGDNIKKTGRFLISYTVTSVTVTHTHTHTHIRIQGVTGGTDQTSGGCS